MPNQDTFIYLRNTASGVTSTVSVEEAAMYLTHEHFKHYYVQVDAPGDEVLAQPYKLNDDGERVTFVQEKPIPDERFQSPEPSADAAPADQNEDAK